MKNRYPTVIVLALVGSACQCRQATEGGKAPSAEAIASEPTERAPASDPATATFRGAFTQVARDTVPSVVSVISEKQVAMPANRFDFFGEGTPFDFFFGPSQRQSPHPQQQAPAPPQRQFRERGLGSGFIATENGYILTNNHVVAGAQKLQIQLSDERQFDAEVVGTDEPTDLAVVKMVDGLPEGLRPLDLGDSDALEIGEWVVAIGSPFGLYETVTTGIVSAKGRQDTGISAYGNFLQTDAAINPGNSGGPLVNLDGEVIGINTAIYSKTGGSQGVGFAIPVNLARSIMTRLIEDGTVTRGWLGVSIQPLSPALAEAMKLEDAKGALIGDVLPGGPAEKAGIQRGDVVVALDGKDVESVHGLMNAVALLAPGTTTDVVLLRGGNKVTVKATIGKREQSGTQQDGGSGAPSDTDLSRLGLVAASVSPQTRRQFGIDESVKQGAVIVQVTPGGAAETSGLQPGDVILELNRVPIASAGDLSAAVQKAPKDQPILALVERDGNTSFVAIVR